MCEDAAGLGVTQHQVIGPFEACGGAGGIMQGDGGEQCPLRCGARRGVGAQQHREVEIAGRGLPLAPMGAAPGGLAAGEDGEAGRRALLRRPRRHEGGGAGQAIENLEAELQPRMDATAWRAAASSGAGKRKKKVVLKRNYQLNNLRQIIKSKPIFRMGFFIL